MKAKSGKAPAPSLPVEEWNFIDFGLLPDDQIEHCCFYEYARESDVAKDMAKTMKRLSVQYANKGKEAVALFACRSCLGIVALCPEFPEVPWLSIPNAERKARIRKAVRTTTTLPGLREIAPSDYTLPHRLKALQLRIDTHRLTPEYEAIHPRPQDDFLFHIDLDRATKGLVAEFETWVRQKKLVLGKQLNKKAELYPDAPKRKNLSDGRGRGREPIARLRQLAAWRILRAGLTLDEACKQFPSIYAQPADWSRARTQAQNHVDDLFPRGLHPKPQKQTGAISTVTLGDLVVPLTLIERPPLNPIEFDPYDFSITIKPQVATLEEGEWNAFLQYAYSQGWRLVEFQNGKISAVYQKP
jgi:hypothetical protein